MKVAVETYRLCGRLLVVTAAALSTAVFSASAATLPVDVQSAGAIQNGRIAFEVPSDTSQPLDTINPDGTLWSPVTGVPNDTAEPAWSADGSQLAFSSAISSRAQIYLIDADGTGRRPVTKASLRAIDPTWSPDGTAIAFSSRRNGVANIYVVTLATGLTRRLTADRNLDLQPRWSPNGNLIAFASNRLGSFQIFTMTTSGGNQKPLMTQVGSNSDPAWSPNGTQLAYTNTNDGASHLYAIDLPSGAPRLLTTGHGMDHFPAWSPDGQQIAFTRDGGIWVIPSRGDVTVPQAKQLTGVGTDPIWAALIQPTAKLVAGAVTVLVPGATAGMPISDSLSLPTGTVVDANAGSALLEFKKLSAPLSAPPSKARVTGTTVKISARSASRLTLSVKPLTCRATGREARVRHRHRRRRRSISAAGGVNVYGPGVHFSSPGTRYRVTFSCRGTRLKVTQGVVVVTTLRRHKRRILVRAGHSFFAPAMG